MTQGLVVDLFAGGGGTSLGIEWAFGRSPDIAINHDREAIAMHEANHPETKHYHEDVRKVDIRKVVAGRPVAFLWLSPDCKHFSKSKGGKPVDRKIRGLAWEAVRWAEVARPSVICLENVQEFRDWGPLNKDNRPNKLQKGFTYRCFKGRLRALGYRVEDRLLRACDYGAPTTRERLFLVARCDGRPIVWPKPTHSKEGAGGLLPWRMAAECIDFWRPCLSIFLTAEEAKQLGVKRPLAEKTERRIYRGIDRFVINNPRPFLVRYNGDEWRGQDVGQPLTTLDTSNRFGLVAPTVTKFRGDSAGRPVTEPLFTITGGPKDNPAGAAHALGLIAPTIVPVNHGGDLRTHSAEEPLRTITGAHRGEHALLAAVLAGAGGPEYGGKPRSVDRPINTVLPDSRASIVAPILVPRYGEREGQEPRARHVEQPAATIVPTANGDGLAVAFMAKHYGCHETPGSQLELPVDTITARDHNSLVASHLVKLKGTCRDGQPVETPLHTIQAGGYHYAEVRAFLIKYHDNGGQWGDLFRPSPTVVANDSLGLVMVEGVPHAIVDIGMRMLVARELFRCQGFPDSYQIDVECLRQLRGRLVQSRLPGDAQVRMVGNSVPPQLAEALAAANAPELAEENVA